MMYEKFLGVGGGVLYGEERQMEFSHLTCSCITKSQNYQIIIYQHGTHKNVNVHI